jgi:diaminopimelate decarboxylase
VHDFYYKGTKLYCESIAVEELVQKAGTPLYIYSQKTILENIRRLQTAMAPVEPHLCYAVKANASLGILRLMAQQGIGFDVVSSGELNKVKYAGGQTQLCVFAGVGKTEIEIDNALELGVYAFNVESIPELERINRLAKKKNKKAPVAIRVNPNVDAKTHAKITTGTYENKFGIAFEEVESLYQKAHFNYKNIHLKGVQIHIGSQLTTVSPFEKAMEKMAPLVASLKEKYGIEFFSIGGGLGIAYEQALESGSARWWQNEGKDFASPEKLADALIPFLKPLFTSGIKILMEPGRFIMGNAGILATRVEYVKQTGKKNFVIVDAAMNDLIRPALYESYHQIIPLEKTRVEKTFTADIVGPVCESADTFGLNREISQVKEGDLLAIMSAGAYGITMASNYNGRAIPAEILVNNTNADYLRTRESIQATWHCEGIPEWLLGNKEMLPPEESGVCPHGKDC